MNVLGSFFEKYSNIKFHENPSSESRVVTCGRTDIDMAKLLAAFRIFCEHARNLNSSSNVDFCTQADFPNSWSLPCVRKISLLMNSVEQNPS